MIQRTRKMVDQIGTVVIKIERVNTECKETRISGKEQPVGV